MDERRLAIFAAVARELNFSRAASSLHLSQPAVSQQIRALESDLGARLFERTPQRVRLTDAGRAFQERAEGLFRELAEARRAVSAAVGEISGELKIGASLTVGEYVLPPVLARFGLRYPSVRARVTIENTEKVVASLLAGEAEIGFVEGEVREPAITLRPFRRDELVVIAPAGHPWSRRSEVELGDLAAEPLVLREPGSGTRQVAESYLESAGIDPADLNVVAELSGMEAIKSAVEAGLGVSILSRSTSTKELRLGTLVARPVRGLPLLRDMSVALVVGRVVGPAARELIALISGLEAGQTAATLG